MFTKRRLPDGKPVRSYAQFCQWIRTRVDGVQEAELPFEGRNTVFWHKGLDGGGGGCGGGGNGGKEGEAELRDRGGGGQVT